MMTCGHSPNGKDAETGMALCIICQCYDLAPVPDLTDRTARCMYSTPNHDRKRLKSDWKEYEPSQLNLPFFRYRPEKPYDSFYCFCRGSD